MGHQNRLRGETATPYEERDGWKQGQARENLVSSCLEQNQIHIVNSGTVGKTAI